MAVASAISQARGGAPFCRATPMIVAAFCRCSSLSVAAVRPGRAAAGLGDRPQARVAEAGHERPPPPPVPPW